MTGTMLLALFGAGIASFVAPCVVPLVPAWLGLVGADLASDPEVAAGRPPRPPLTSTLSFVAGFSAVFVLLGVLAGQIGSLASAVSEEFRRVGGALVVVFGVLLLIDRLGRHVRPRRWLPPVDRFGTRARPFVIGVAFGAAWTPCVGPLLGSALVVAADAGGAFDGAVLLLAYAAGVGVPFVATALVLSSFPSLTARLGRLSLPLSRVSAVSLIVLGLVLVFDLQRVALSPLVRLGPGA